MCRLSARGGEPLKSLQAVRWQRSRTVGAAWLHSPPRRLSPARRLTEEDLTHYGRSAKGSEPHIKRTPSRVDSGPDQALQLHDRPLWGSIATLDDPISLHEWLHALPEGHRPLGGHPNPLNVDSSAVEITTRGVALPQIGEVELSRRVGPVPKARTAPGSAGVVRWPYARPRVLASSVIVELIRIGAGEPGVRIAGMPGLPYLGRSAYPYPVVSNPTPRVRAPRARARPPA